MTRLHYNVPAAKEQKPWKRRVSGVLVMLTIGYNKRSGRLSHELIAEIKEKFNYRTDRAIRDIWKKHKQQIMSGDPMTARGTGTKMPWRRAWISMVWMKRRRERGCCISWLMFLFVCVERGSARVDGGKRDLHASFFT